MERIFLFIAGLLFSMQVMAQTGIGTTTPNASAKLDVYSTNKGFLPPRVSLTDAYDQTTIPSPATGLLVYCKGDAGLAAGYYFWNGNAWATIATAGGSGSVAAEFGSQILSSGVTVSSATPVDVMTFTLPSAGTWEVITFLRAQGTPGYAAEFALYDASSILVPDSEILPAYGQTGSTGTGVVRITTTGTATYKLKAWASGGSSYPYNVTTDGNGKTGITWKKISGNAPVTGQSVDYGLARYTGSDGTSLSANAIVAFDASAAGNLAWSGNKFSLKANKTYEIESYLSVYHASAGVAGVFQIYNYTNASVLASGLYISINGSGGYNVNGNGPMRCIITPTTDIEVGVRISTAYGGWPSIVGSTSTIGASGAPNQSYLLVKQIGSSAFVNPWVLTGSDVYNTTGNVGIGTTTPLEKLEVSGNVKANNFIGTASSSKLFLLEAYANVSYTLPGSYTYDLCRYSIVNNTVNVPSSWFNTSTYTFTPQKAGYWEIRASYDVYRNSEAGLIISKNGTNIGTVDVVSGVNLIVSKIVYLNGSSDYINIYNIGNTSNARGQGAATSWFQARWVGE